MQVAVDRYNVSVSFSDNEKIIRGSKNITCQITFDGFWDEYLKTVVFSADCCCGKTYEVYLGDLLAESLTIPWEVLQKSGSFKIGVYGAGINDEVVLPTLWSDDIPVLYGTSTSDNDSPEPPTPDLYSQIIKELHNKQDKIDEYLTDAEADDENLTIKKSNGDRIVVPIGGSSESIQKTGSDLDETDGVVEFGIYQCTSNYGAKQSIIVGQNGFVIGYFYQYQGDNTYFITRTQPDPVLPETVWLVTSEWIYNTVPAGMQNKTVQCTDTGNGYLEGYFYKSKNQNGSWVWQQLDVQPHATVDKSYNASSMHNQERL